MDGWPCPGTPAPGHAELDGEAGDDGGGHHAQAGRYVQVGEPHGRVGHP